MNEGPYIQSGSARVGRVLFAVLITGMAALVAASGAIGAKAGDPGSDPSNPITQVGRPASAPTYVDIFWPDGGTETVQSSQPPSQALAVQVLLERARAEHRTRLPGGGATPLGSDGGGGTACTWSLYGPYKASSTTVAADATVYCTPDVTTVYGTLYLFRSADYTLIGSDSESGGSAVIWGTSGGCLSSTWQYHAELVYAFFSEVNGAFYPAPKWNGPAWISC